MGFSGAFGPGFAGRGVRSPNPIRELNDSAVTGNWFEGIVLAGVFFEAWGKKRLRMFLEQKSVPFPLMLEQAHMWPIIHILYEFGIISAKTKSNMEDVWKKRNKLVHRLEERYRMTASEARETLAKAVEVMKQLAPEWSDHPPQKALSKT